MVAGTAGMVAGTAGMVAGTAGMVAGTAGMGTVGTAAWWRARRHGGGHAAGTMVTAVGSTATTAVDIVAIMAG